MRTGTSRETPISRIRPLQLIGETKSRLHHQPHARALPSTKRDGSKATTPSGLTSSTTYYDLAGRPIATSNGAGTTCSSYDNEGRLASDQAPGDLRPVFTPTTPPAPRERPQTRQER